MKKSDPRVNKDTAAFRQACGIAGEDAAARLLQKKGFRILERNLHVKKKEIDIIAESREFLVFVEVKARTVPYLDEKGNSPYPMTPAMAVNRQKQRFVYTAASQYLLRHPTEKQPRIDVIEVYLREIPNTSPQKFELLRIHHIENAFGVS